MGRSAAEDRKVEIRGERFDVGDGLDRLRSPDPRQHVEQGNRLDTLLAQMRGAIGAEPLRQFPLCRHQKRFVRKGRRRRPERLEHLYLDGAVRHMVLAADHVGDAEIDVVDHAWQQIEPAAVLAPNDRVAEQFRIELLLAANEVGPHDRVHVIESEAPVRRPAFGRRGNPLGRALVDRRQAAAEQHLAPKLELLGRFVSGIDAAS